MGERIPPVMKHREKEVAAGPVELNGHAPKAYLRAECLKGTGEYE